MVSPSDFYSRQKITFKFQNDLFTLSSAVKCFDSVLFEYHDFALILGEDKSLTYIPLPPTVCLESAKIWQTRDQTRPDQGLSSPAPEGGKERDPGNEVTNKLDYKHVDKGDISTFSFVKAAGK